MARIAFMGTPEFAVPTLVALTEHHKVVGVVTQPDRQAGRGRKVVASPVKQVALERRLPIYQAKNLRTPEAVDRLAAWQPELIVVAAFGQILAAPVLDLPPHGCLNVHASLLPRYRGAAPIAAAILDGEPVSGVTIMCMDPGLDTGPILTQAECAIAPDDTTASLTAKMADLGAQLLIETVPGWLGGTLPALPQDDTSATYCQPLTKQDGLLEWSRTAIHLDRHVRACDPWPGAFTTWQERILKVLRARPHPSLQGEGNPGMVVGLDPGIGVIAGKGILELLDLQLAGKRSVDATQFARGQRDFVGSILG